jgi:uncharacterized protein
VSKIQGVIKTLDPSLQLYKVADKEERIIEGYFTTVDVDQIGDVSLPSAFAKTFENYMKNPVLTFMHDIRNVIGKVLTYRIEEKGVWVRAQIAKGVQYIDDVWKLIEQDMIKGFSYGYRVKDEKKEMKEGQSVNVLHEVDLFEIAVVTVPMNGNAQFALSGGAVKGISLNLGEFIIPEEKIIEEKKTIEEVKPALEVIVTEPVIAAEVENKEGKEDEMDVKELAKELILALKEEKEFIKSLIPEPVVKEVVKEVVVEEKAEVIEKQEEKVDDTAIAISEIKKMLLEMVKAISPKEEK